MEAGETERLSPTRRSANPRRPSRLMGAGLRTSQTSRGRTRSTCARSRARAVKRWSRPVGDRVQSGLETAGSSSTGRARGRESRSGSPRTPSSETPFVPRSPEHGRRSAFRAGRVGSTCIRTASASRSWKPRRRPRSAASSSSRTSSTSFAGDALISRGSLRSVRDLILRGGFARRASHDVSSTARAAFAFSPLSKVTSVRSDVPAKAAR